MRGVFAICAVACVFAQAAVSHPPPDPGGATGVSGPPLVLRVATFNVEDVRTEDLLDPSNPRLCRIAEIIQRIRPNVILLNEIAYDMPGAPGVPAAAGPVDATAAAPAPEGLNGQRFIDNFLSRPQAAGLAALRMRAFMAPVNTGIPSGLDLDKDGGVVTEYPAPVRPKPGESPVRDDAGDRYARDCWGYGRFPGQYGMALLVDERLEIQKDKVRTFRLLPWDYMPGALTPRKADGSSWFSADELGVVRLSSKSHWDVPVALPNGAVVHFLCSHPTPPAFDGPEKRNARRNRDEIRFWADYLENAAYIVDDANTPGGLDRLAHFVILGDLNADPDEGQSYKNPIQNDLFACRRVETSVTPISDVVVPGLDPDDTARFKMRVDYVLPSKTMGIMDSGVWRYPPAGMTDFPSDHFPVWMEIGVPADEAKGSGTGALSSPAPEGAPTGSKTGAVR